MFRVKIDSKEVNKLLGNTVSYSYGFLDGIGMDQILFNKTLGEYTAESLGQYIDAQSRINPDALHHVYEWNAVGDNSQRLFKITSNASKRIIRFDGKFLPSKTVSDSSTTPFVDKANIMENRISVVVEPKDANVLAFEDNGQTVFTTNAIYIANPGGDAVAGSFGRVVDDFFNNYFTGAILRPFLKTLSSPKEYSKYLPAGTKNGKMSGVTAGKAYLRSAGATIQ